jgi:hypothetical protein
LREERAEGIPREGMVVDEQDSLGHVPLIGRQAVAVKTEAPRPRSGRL